ncbi:MULTISPECIES: hypothetical protein [unclassified Microcoleus]
MQPETISSGLCYGGIHSGRSLDLVEFEMERAIVSLDRAIACDSIVAR